ncbi:MAG: hypothetical protein ACREQ5_18355, partial [Candidatus Dormibacteria bacterium]
RSPTRQQPVSRRRGGRRLIAQATDRGRLPGREPVMARLTHHRHTVAVLGRAWLAGMLFGVLLFLVFIATTRGR